MNTIQEPRCEKIETLKDIIENISAINSEMNSHLQTIADALMHGSHPTNNDKNFDNPPAIMDAIQYERGKAEENLKLLISIRECLW